MTTDEERPEWLRRCEEVNATEHRTDGAEVKYLFWLMMATPPGVAILFWWGLYRLYHRLRRQD